MDAKPKETDFLSFHCPICHQEIEAPVAMANQKAECPACAAQIVVPAVSAAGTLDAPVKGDAKGPSKEQLEAMKSRTLRIELGDW